MDYLKCRHCGDPFGCLRTDALYCSNACRQAAYRRRLAQLGIETDTHLARTPWIRRRTNAPRAARP